MPMQIEHLCHAPGREAKVIFADTAVNAAIAYVRFVCPASFPIILSVGICQYLADNQFEMMIVEVTNGRSGIITRRF